MVVPWLDKKAVGRLDERQVAHRVRAEGMNQNPAWEYAKVGKQLAAHDFCKWL